MSTIPEQFAAAFRLFSRSLAYCWPVSLLAVLVGQAPSAYLEMRGVPLALDAPKDAGWFAVMGLASVVTLWAWLFLMYRQRSVQRRETLSLLGAGRQAAAQVPQVLLLLVAMAAWIAGGALLLLLPGLYLAVALWPALAIRLFENKPIREVIDLSLLRVRGRWSDTAGLMALTLIAVLGWFVVGSLVGLVLGGPGSAISAALFPPFVTAVLCVQHEALRSQRDAQVSSSSSSA